MRAISVLAILLFHADFDLFRGGFVGVDIFFVISGYLITNILIEDIENNRFSILKFYQRRARRILPALFLVIFFCIPFAWIWMSPIEIKDFSQSLVAISFFLSNILFWLEGGYFASISKEKPLIHTWSLSIEEQYYLFFPLLLIFFWRFGRNKVFWIIILLATLSLLATELASTNKASTKFYLIQFRAWELFAGSICAFIIQKSGPVKNDTLAFIGLLIIIFSIFANANNNSSSFSILNTLPTVLGAVLVVIYADKNTIISKILSLKIFVGIGIISYSLYLWSQPLLAFARIKSPDNLTPLLKIILIMITFAIAYLSWRYVENPIRHKKTISLKTTMLCSILCICLFSITGFILPKIEKIRFNTYQKLILSDRENNFKILKNSAYDRFGCFFNYNQDATDLIKKNCIIDSNKPRLILFGDSEAAHFYEGMQKIFPDRHVMQFTGTSCRAINFKKNNDRCKKFYNLFISEVVPKLKIDDIVIISSNWWNTFKEIKATEFSLSLKQILLKIKKKTNNVVIFTNAPEFKKNPYETLAITLADINYENKSVFLPSENIWDSDLAIKSVADEMQIILFNLSEFLCKSDKSCIFRDNNNYFYFDNSHFSFYGSEYVSRYFRSYFDTLNKN